MYLNIMLSTAKVCIVTVMVSRVVYIGAMMATGEGLIGSGAGCAVAESGVVHIGSVEARGSTHQ